MTALSLYPRIDTSTQAAVRAYGELSHCLGSCVSSRELPASANPSGIQSWVLDATVFQTWWRIPMILTLLARRKTRAITMTISRH